MKKTANRSACRLSGERPTPWSRRYERKGFFRLAMGRTAATMAMNRATVVMLIPKAEMLPALFRMRPPRMQPTAAGHKTRNH